MFARLFGPKLRKYTEEDLKLLELTAVWALDACDTLEEAPDEQDDDYERGLTLDFLQQFQALITRCIGVIDPTK